MDLVSFSFFGSNLRILPVRNSAEIVKGMLTVAKVKTKMVHECYLVGTDYSCCCPLIIK